MHRIIAKNRLNPQVCKRCQEVYMCTQAPGEITKQCICVVPILVMSQHHNTADKRPSSVGMSWVGDGLTQKQVGTRCALHAVNNLLASVVASPASFEKIRLRYCRQYRRNGWSLSGLGKPKRGPGSWALNIPIEWLNTHSYKVLALRGRRLRRTVFRLGRKRRMLLLSVCPPEDPDKRHVICIRDNKILDSERGVAPLDEMHWSACVHTLESAYEVKRL